MSSHFYTYGVEYSNQRNDDAYVVFYRKSSIDPNDVTYGQTISNDLWSQFSTCNRTYDSDTIHCSLFALFDNAMNIWLRLATNDSWCNEGVNASDYEVFDVEMEISHIVVFALQFDECNAMQNDSDKKSRIQIHSIS